MLGVEVNIPDLRFPSYLIRVFGECVETLLACHFPHFHLPIRARVFRLAFFGVRRYMFLPAGGEVFIVRTEGDRQDPGCVAGHGSDQSGMSNIIHLYVTIIRP